MYCIFDTPTALSAFSSVILAWKHSRTIWTISVIRSWRRQHQSVLIMTKTLFIDYIDWYVLHRRIEHLQVGITFPIFSFIIALVAGSFRPRQRGGRRNHLIMRRYPMAVISDCRTECTKARLFLSLYSLRFCIANCAFAGSSRFVVRLTNRKVCEVCCHPDHQLDRYPIYNYGYTTKLHLSEQSIEFSIKHLVFITIPWKQPQFKYTLLNLYFYALNDQFKYISLITKYIFFSMFYLVYK